LMNILPQAVIRKKRDGERLTPEEIRFFIGGVTDGTLPDYQIAALLMAIFFRGLDGAELACWADAMLHSGEVVDLSHISRPKVDKHSTGGVGDKISLPLAPAAAVCGLAVPMVSGRGLGHSGGTLDKLEAIPGFRVDLDVSQFLRQVEELGVCLIGQTSAIAPADRCLYALRDVTATVECVPLIASSIMSKKLAEGIEALVLDVKVGKGAFMKETAEARALFQAMRVIGEAAGVKVSALLTAMSAPIGHMVGHALEVQESLEVLRGGGPRDTRELTVRLGAEMLLAGGVAGTEVEGVALIERALDSGAALERFARVIEAQGGDASVVEQPSRLPRAASKTPVLADRPGVVAEIDGHSIGMATIHLGGGRVAASDQIDPAVGVELHCAVGESVAAGQPLAFVHQNGRGVARACELVQGAFRLAERAEPPGSRILEVLR
jgi:pyrimidine-nucleoside phosphorylase